MNFPATELGGINDLLTHPLSPPLLKIEGDDHSQNSPSLGKRRGQVMSSGEEEWSTFLLRSRTPRNSLDLSVFNRVYPWLIIVPL